jgi:hypothetical protein
MSRVLAIGRRLGYAVMWAALGGTGEALAGGSVHDAIRYSIGVLTGAFIGLGMAAR